MACPGGQWLPLKNPFAVRLWTSSLKRASQSTCTMGLVAYLIDRKQRLRRDRDRRGEKRRWGEGTEEGKRGSDTHKQKHKTQASKIEIQNCMTPKWSHFEIIQQSSPEPGIICSLEAFGNVYRCAFFFFFSSGKEQLGPNGQKPEKLFIL